MVICNSSVRQVLNHRVLLYQHHQHQHHTDKDNGESGDDRGGKEKKR